MGNKELDFGTRFKGILYFEHIIIYHLFMIGNEFIHIFRIYPRPSVSVGMAIFGNLRVHFIDSDIFPISVLILLASKTRRKYGIAGDPIHSIEYIVLCLM